ncbi:MAG TPA: DUF2288 domain-containing protein [Cyanobacteria bacterium UBA11149]|nr:DUF2288 domain-containing protein [Cyanobacteria bacterium UBA11367]HBE58153.1 DUF2288 domain-containing protein [Cyanobacteria bacterium UBA11366]HBK64147.1 DUF2288 domain-containing protein [Cyanobacteria bacterium UBA11166]HBR75471.1 DUF2288 domain-containing protein [Cyanobacteria bacterium UBA11159]HBS71127.1 DUF2288 domain-containing protein [Cyanobacteria bacterium UBA11153]HBW88747.1 DUF2288 domain-containing protein [Cyanobacteria bacterium UBA11149]HCA94400.1 DUF2288 domain-conta
MQDLRAELAQALDEAEWEWLIPHVKRDVVIFVTKDLDLLDVGVAFARDDTLSVESWISKQQLHKPFPDQLNMWNSDKTIRFQALIVQPYVLVQQLAIA